MSDSGHAEADDGYRDRPRRFSGMSRNSIDQDLQFEERRQSRRDDMRFTSPPPSIPLFYHGRRDLEYGDVGRPGVSPVYGQINVASLPSYRGTMRFLERQMQTQREIEHEMEATMRARLLEVQRSGSTALSMINVLSKRVSARPETPGITTSSSPPFVLGLESPRESNTRTKLLNLLSPHPVGLVHDHLSELRIKDSGTWLFKLPQVVSWLSPAAESPESVGPGGNCLWLQGNLGAGKTMLMNAFVDWLKSQISNGPGQESIVAYYYFNRSYGCKPYQAFSSILRQICEQKDFPLPTFLASMEANLSDAAAADTKNQEPGDGIYLANLISDLLTLTTRLKSLYVCLDGLEECHDLFVLMATLYRLKAIPQIHLVLTARSRIVEQCIAIGIGREETVVELEGRNSSDIRGYLEEVISRPANVCLSDMMGAEARLRLLAMLTEKTGGNFLSTVAQTAQLNRLASLAEIADHIERPPVTIPEAVNFLLNRLNDQSPQRSQLSRHIFYWLSVARRPLSLEELQHAISAEPGAKADEPGILPPPSLITSVCMGLIHTDMQKNMVYTKPSALPFYFYQFSEEFAQDARQYASNNCLAVLRSPQLSEGPFTSQRQYNDMERSLPFINYVSQNWGVHLNDAGDEESTNQILDNDSLLQTLSQILHVGSMPLPRSYDHYPEGFGSHHFAAYFGLSAAFKRWPTQEDWQTPSDSWGRSPFHSAFCSPGLRECNVVFDLDDASTISRLIVEKSLQPTMTDYSTDEERSIDSSSIHEETTHEDTTRKGATDEEATLEEPSPTKPTRPDATHDHDENNDAAKPFHHEEIEEWPWKWRPPYLQSFREEPNDWSVGMNLRTLFNFSRGEMEMVDRDGKAPLHNFLSNWSEDTIATLFECIIKAHDIDSESEGSRSEAGEGGEPAAESTVVKEGEDKASEDGGGTGEGSADGSEVFPYDAVQEWARLQTITDKSGRTTLDYAFERNAMLGTLVMVTHNTSPELIDRFSVLGASRGHTALVSTVLNSNTGGPFALGPPMIEASKRGFTDMARVLRQNGAPVNISDDKGMSPLHHAAYGRHVDTVRFLLLEGGNANQLDKEGRSPLFCGCESESDDVVTLLREKGASATRKISEDGQTLLHLAARKGQVDVARRLLSLDSGSLRLLTPDAGKAESPLHVAAREGKHAVVELLIEEDLYVDTRNADGRTPLSCACEAGHLQSVLLLLNMRGRPPGVDSKDNHGRTPLSYAAAGGHVEAVAALLSQGGANPNIRDAEGKTALIHAAQGGHGDTVVVLMLLACSNITIKAVASRSFPMLYTRFYTNSTGSNPVDVKAEDKQGRTAISYLRDIQREEASDVANFLEDISGGPRPNFTGSDFETEPEESKSTAELFKNQVTQDAR